MPGPRRRGTCKCFNRRAFCTKSERDGLVSIASIVAVSSSSGSGALGFRKNAVIDAEERSAYDHEETYAKEAARQTGEAKQSLRRAQTVSDQHRGRQSRRGRELLLEIIGAERTHASRLALLFRLW